MSWFYAMHLFAISKDGVAALELQRHLGVTYKTAWRIGKQIRKPMKQDAKLGGVGCTVEVDETYYGGRHRGRYWYYQKATIVGAIERGGKVRAKHMSGANVSTIFPYLKEHVRPGTVIYTDTSDIYKKLYKYFINDQVNHKIKEYARGDTHTNTIEGFWGQLKRSINGTYHSASKKHMQMYIDEFVFKYNHRSDSWTALITRCASSLFAT